MTTDIAAAGVRIHSLTEFTTIWALQRAKFGWLLGAGVSASAGVPLASSIRDRLLFDRYAAKHNLVRQNLDQTDPAQVERIHAYFDGSNGMPPLGSDSDYSAAFDLCLPDPSARKALLQDLIEDVRPGFGQRVFGGLVISGACDLAITTNFDRLIERGVHEAQRAGTDLRLPLQRELHVAGLDSTARAAVAIQERQWPLIVKLHGDFREKRLMNTESELQQQDVALRQFVADVSRQFGLAVSGYSGRDRSVMQMLEQTVRRPGAWPYGIWWLIRPNSPIPDSVRGLLTLAARQGVAANLVSAASFDETMSALARQVVVDEPMRNYFDGLHPKPRTTPAALPRHSRDWPVLRFNALPVAEASVEVTRIAVPAGWRRRMVRNAMTPRADWPVVVNGPGEVLCLGEPEAALRLLGDAARLNSLPHPGPATTSQIDLLADDAPAHHQLVLLQVVAHALQQSMPLRMRTGKDGNPELIVTDPAAEEAAGQADARTRLRLVYDGPLTGYLPAKYGQVAPNRNRRWAEEVHLSLDRRAGRHWVLFTPSTWIQPLPGEVESDALPSRDADPADSWRVQRWAERRFNEKWADMLRAWTTLLAPEDPTLLTVPAATPGGVPTARVLLGRTNAYSRPTW
ncbi:SIR2 family protein [Blastococcus sp. PRF04-17]|uniref:SIR2 family protein n=1 Tax=Blastococcus sp. PRF04-17 TaxID=2933797 RepID=UPI001FF46579|nr:SIR2 family protein [Blastococcus sp. PRF04-17]UOY03223.1 SIR2 family protein [Blastococcus sp. PRF04-17]